ncbi:cysteine peptidase family C39 domain-containing protein [Candidatus Margulisiibacteriota bacterium]
MNKKISLKKILVNITIFPALICSLAIASLIMIGFDADLKDTSLAGRFIHEPARFINDFINPAIEDTSYICQKQYEETGLIAALVSLLELQGVEIGDHEISEFVNMNHPENILMSVNKFLHQKNLSLIQKQLNLKDLIDQQKPFIVYSQKYKRYQVVKGVLKEKWRVLLGDQVLGNFNENLFTFMRSVDDKTFIIQ